MPSSEPTGARGMGEGWTAAVAMPTHLRAQFFTPAAWTELRRLAHTWVPGDHTDLLREVDRARLAVTDVLVTGWGTQQVRAETLALMPRLRAVVHTGGSLRKLVAPEVHERGIRVSSQAENNAVAVAEYTLAMVILALKGVPGAARTYARERRPVDVYRSMGGAGVYRRTVGLVGASKVGRRVIHLLRCLDVDVIVHDPYLDDEDAAALGVRPVGLAELAAASDVVSVHAPANRQTQGMIDATFLAAMPDGATLINTARGSVIDEEALVAEVASGRIGAILDVTDPVLPVPESSLWTLPNVVLTPHVAGALGVELQRLGDAVVDEVRLLVSGHPMRYEVAAEQLAALA